MTPSQSSLQGESFRMNPAYGMADCILDPSLILPSRGGNKAPSPVGEGGGEVSSPPN